MNVPTQTLDQWAEADRKIEARHESATLALMEHRWKAINEGGFSIREYARAIERDKSTVRQYVAAWDAWTRDAPGGGAPPGRPADYIEIAKMGAEQAEATEIVAEAKGLTVGTVRKTHAHVVRGVRVEIDRRTELGEPREEAVRNVRSLKVGAERINQQAAKNRERRRGLFSSPYFQIDGLLNRARLATRDAVRIAQESNLTNEEERELLLDHVDHLERLAGLARVAINGGDLATDWDAAAADLLEGSR